MADDAQSQFVLSVKNGDAVGVKAAIENGAQVDRRENGRTGLHEASEAGHVDVVRLLVASGADAHLRSGRGEDHGGTALHLAAEGGHTSVLRALLRAKVNPEAIDDKGRRPVHWAAYAGQLEALQVLRDCDLHARDKEKSSVVHLAAAHGDVAVVRWLMHVGVNPALRDHRNHLAKDVAKARGNTDVYRFLKQQNEGKTIFTRSRSFSAASSKSVPSLAFDDVGLPRERNDPPPAHTLYRTHSQEDEVNEVLEDDTRHSTAKWKQEVDLEVDREVDLPIPRLEAERNTVVEAQGRLQRPLVVEEEASNKAVVTTLREQLFQVSQELNDLKCKHIREERPTEGKQKGAVGLLNEARTSASHVGADPSHVWGPEEDMSTYTTRAQVEARQDTMDDAPPLDPHNPDDHHTFFTMSQKLHEKEQAILAFKAELREKQKVLEEVEEASQQTTDVLKDKVERLKGRLQVEQEKTLAAQRQEQKAVRDLMEQKRHMKNMDELKKNIHNMSAKLRQYEENTIIYKEQLRESQSTSQSTIASLEQRVDSLTRKLEVEQRQLTSAESRLEEARQKSVEREKASEKNTDDLNKNIYHMTMRLREHETTISSYEMQLRDTQIQLEKSELDSQEAMGKLKDEVNHLSQRLEDEKRRATSAQNIQEGRTRELLERDKVRKKIMDDLNETIYRKSSKVKDLEETISKYKDELHEKEMELKDLEVANQQTTTKLKDEINLLSQRLENERRRVTSTEERLKETEKEMAKQEEASKRNIFDLNTNMFHMSSKLNQYEETIESYKGQLDDRDKKIQDLETSNQRIVSSLKEEVQSLSHRLEEEQRKLTSAEEEHQSRIQVFQEEEGKNKLTLASLMDQFQEVSDQLQQQRHTNLSHEGKLKQFQQQEANCRRLIDQLKEDLAIKTEKITEHDQTISSYQVQIRHRDRQAEQRERANQQTIEVLRDKVDGLSQMLDAGHHKMAYTEDLHERLQDLKQQDAAKKETIAKLTQQLTEASHKMNAQNQRTFTDQGKLNQLVIQREVDRKTMEDLHQRLALKSTKLREYEVLIASYQAQVRDSGQTREQRDDETIASLKQEVQHLAKALKEERQATAHAQEKTAELQEQDRVHKMNISDLSIKLKGCEKTIYSYEVREKELLKKEDALRITLRDVSQKLQNTDRASPPHSQARLDQQVQELTLQLEEERRARAKEQVEKDLQIASLTSQKGELGHVNNPEGHSASENSARIVMPSGLPNLGNTCYINAVVQCLYQVNRLKEYLVRDLYRKDVHRGGEFNGEVATSLAGVFKALYSGIEREIWTKIKHFKGVVATCDPDLDDTEQHDAYDLLSGLLTWLHNDLAKADGSSLVTRYFHGDRRSVITCDRHGGQVSNDTEAFAILTLPVTQGKTCTLQDLLNSHYKERRIEWECRFCGTDHLCRHQTTLRWTPPVFIIHLSRYSNQKTRVIIPKDSLSLQGYMEPEHQSRPYELFAVVIHHGTTSSGHYTSCCRNQHGKTWRTYDDKAVHTTDLQRVLNDHVPHLLFYTQQQG